MLSSYFFLCLPCLLPPFTVPCKIGSGQILGSVREEMRRPHPPLVSWLWVKDLVSTHHWGGYLHSSKTRARWAQGFYDELIGHVFDLERDGLRQVVPCRHSPYDENKPVEYGNSVSPLSYVLIIFVRLSSQSSLLSRLLFFNRSWILKSRQPHWDASRRRKTYSFL